MIRHTISAAWVSGIANMLASQGLNVRDLFSEAGIDIAALANLDERFSTEKVSLLWELAALRSGNPAIAVAAPRAVQLASFEVLGYAMISCPNLLAGAERLVRYLRLVTAAAEATLHNSSGEYRINFEIFGGRHAVPRQRYEYDLLAFLAFCRWISGYDVRPLVVEFAQPAPANPQIYADAFDCPLRFNAPSYCLRFSDADLVRPLPTSNHSLAELHDRILSERLDQLDHAQTAYRVRELIMRKLPEGEPKREEIAGALFMSERTLQRRLQIEGTSFHDLLDEVRRELAQQYLRQSRFSLAQAAYLLGFAEQSNFSRACKRWFELSPGQYRIRASSPQLDALANA